MEAPHRLCIGCGRELVTPLQRVRTCRDCRIGAALRDPQTILSWRELALMSVAAPAITLGIMFALLMMAIFPHWLMVTFELGPLAFLLYFPVLYVGGRLRYLMGRLGLR